MALEAGALVDRTRPEPHGGKEGEHPGCRGHGGPTFLPWELLMVIAERQPDVPLEHCVSPYTNDRAPG